MHSEREECTSRDAYTTEKEEVRRMYKQGCLYYREGGSSKNVQAGIRRRQGYGGTSCLYYREGGSLKNVQAGMLILQRRGGLSFTLTHSLHLCDFALNLFAGHSFINYHSCVNSSESMMFEIIS